MQHHPWLATLLATLATTIASVGGTTELLGTLNGLKHSYTLAGGTCLTGDGGAASGFSGSYWGSFDRLPFRWTSTGGLQNLQDSEEAWAWITSGLSRNGVLVVGGVWVPSNGVTVPFYWTAGDGTRRLAWPGILRCAAASGFPAAGRSQDLGTEKPVWLPDATNRLDLPTATYTSGEVLSLSADGATAFGWVSGPGQPVPARWSNLPGSPTLEVPVLPAGFTSGQFYHCTRDGATAVGSVSGAGGSTGFVWSASTGFQLLAGTAIPYCVAENGQLGGEGPAGALWGDVASGLRSVQTLGQTLWGLDFEPWNLTSVRGLSEDGKILLVRVQHKTTGALQLMRITTSDVEPVALRIHRNPGTDQVTLEWDGPTWTLQSCEGWPPAAAWTDLATATTNYSLPATNAFQFFRLRNP